MMCGRKQAFYFRALSIATLAGNARFRIRESVQSYDRSTIHAAVKLGRRCLADFKGSCDLVSNWGRERLCGPIRHDRDALA
jgi:hypothetical protein